MSGVRRGRVLPAQGLRSEDRADGSDHRRADQRRVLLVRRGPDRLRHPGGGGAHRSDRLRPSQGRDRLLPLPLGVPRRVSPHRVRVRPAHRRRPRAGVRAQDPKALAMLEMLRDLIAHKGHANTAVLTAIQQNGAAASDPEVRELLHHVVLANRFWLLTILGLPFVLDAEAQPASSFDALVQRYAATQAQESAWLATATPAHATRVLAPP